MAHSERLARLLFEAGLIQFGLFVDGDGFAAPCRLALDLLPSYPDILAEIASSAARLIDRTHTERLLCPADSIALGAALSLQTGIPLVYSRGGHQPPVHDLVGAYDVGHPAVLVATVVTCPQTVASLIVNAHKVGLNVHSVLALFDLGLTRPPEGILSRSLLRLQEIVIQLESAGQIRSGQARATIDWLERKTQQED